jgi:hypothetical protein
MPPGEPRDVMVHVGAPDLLNLARLELGKRYEMKEAAN